ncbi:MAG: hypothetical protein M3394_02320, partial [Actinomycetota bacterium]|nr:hypothetical protein [Actinomycetota bacterium]
MRRIALALTLVTLATLALPTMAARATVPTETGTVELSGVLEYRTTSGTSYISFASPSCIHYWAPAADGDRLGWFCTTPPALSDSTAAGTTFNLKGSWRTKRSYTATFSLNDLVLEGGAYEAVGTVTGGGRTGTATFTFATAPHPD